MGHPLPREDGEARDGDQREVEGMAKALGGAEADAHSGEGAGAMNHRNRVQFAKDDSAVGGEGADGGYETLCGGAAGKASGGNGRRTGSVGQG